jgi:hypothetical protein
VEGTPSRPSRHPTDPRKHHGKDGSG